MRLMPTNKPRRSRYGTLRVMWVWRPVFSFVFYSVVGGWILLYVLKAVTGSLSGLTQEQYGTVFGTVIENPIQTLIARLYL